MKVWRGSDVLSVHEGHSLDSILESSPARPGGQCSHVGAHSGEGNTALYIQSRSFLDSTHNLFAKYVLLGLYT